jgi:glycosyltransferase involved in cell wall biosynthesis
MKILLLCNKFSIDENNGWLTNDLAQGLAKLGHSVDVICVDWSASSNQPPLEFTTSTGVRALIIPPIVWNGLGKKIGKAGKWLFSSLSARKYIKEKIRERKIDLVIGFSPAATMLAPILAALRNKGVKSYYVLWDFFPYHHQQIGLIKNKVIFHIAKAIEQYLIRQFDVIGCMTPKNVQYLKSHYTLKPSQQVDILPLWGSKVLSSLTPDRLALRKEFSLPEDKVIAVFGGQLTVGRGVEDIIEVAEISQKNNDNVLFLFIGNGPFAGLIKNKIDNGANNIKLIDWIPREAYLNLLAACDIALVCTVKDVDVPTFPSKTIDYFKASLPIAASVEASTDYGDWLKSCHAGIGSKAGDPQAFYENIKMLSMDEEKRRFYGANGNRYFNNQMEVGKICESLVNSIGITVKA